MAPLKVMFCHGVSHFEKSGPDWWRPLDPPLRQALAGASDEVELSFFEYDGLFDVRPDTLEQYAGAFLSMGWSWLSGALGDLFRRRRGIKDWPDMLRWTVGMVAQWDQDGTLQRDLRRAFYEQVMAAKPDLVIGHSMGSLIAYDALTEVDRPDDLPKFKYMTIGSQIGHDAVKRAFAGRLPYPGSVQSWLHVWNPDDFVFTAAIDSPDRPFEGEYRQLVVPRESRKGGLANHAMETYLTEPGVQMFLPTWISMPTNDVRFVLSADAQWGRDQQEPESRRGKKGKEDKEAKNEGNIYVQNQTTPQQVSKGLATPSNRALLIGVNEYADPKNELKGCVNDVFEMSACLQESGLAADEIRVVLDRRATTAGILERLEWLLDDVRDGDFRILYFSGHGARIPVYGADGVPETIVETLVTHDANWDDNLGITDLQLASLYAQLPYNSQLAIVLDCCHSGGMSRDGQRLVRSFDPPDDIRHRSLRWDMQTRMWADREPSDDRTSSLLGGRLPEVTKLGGGSTLRQAKRREYVDTRKRKGHFGPYQPLVIAACKDTQFAFEYRHGVSSYGAFTFALTSTLRDLRSTAASKITYSELVSAVGKKLKRLKYDQTPNLTGPSVRTDGDVPNGMV